MTDHVKPTPEQLKENIDKANKALDTMPVEEEKDTDNTPAPSLDALDKPQDEETPPADPVEDEKKPEEEAADTTKPEEKKEAAKEEEKKPLPPAEERLKESAREANKLLHNNAVLNNAIVEANDLPEPTEDDLKAEYADYEDMTNAEKRFAKENLINKRFREHINKASQEQWKLTQWASKVEEFATDPQTLIDHPELEGKVDAFKAFAGDTKLTGSDFGLLVTSFLYKQSKAKQAEPAKTGQMFERGGSATHETPKPKDDKVPLDEANRLMKTNYDEYKRLLKAGKIAAL